jgi:hypothetical protein
MKSNLFSSIFESYDLKKKLIFTLILALIIPAYIDVQKANAVDCSPTQSRVGNTIIQSFTTTTTCDWSVPAGVSSIRYLVVGGGGSGGSGRGGGGGAGGLLRGNSAVTANQVLEIKVGVGGTGNNTPGSNSNGDTSSITTLSLVAPGGGRGGSHTNAGTNNDATESGATGGSGGGSSINYGSITSAGGSRSGGTVLGNNGAASSATCSTRDGSNRNTGGGGGAGSAGIYGCNTTTNGTPVGFDSPGVKANGGDGVVDTITGTSVTYATGGGGAGGRGNDSQGGSCEAGMYSTGSGEGGSSNVNGGRGQDCDSELSATVANRGAGGGGVTRGAGGNGGSGIVIISYASTTPTYGGSCTSGTVTQTFDTSTGAQVEIFNAPASGDANCNFVVPAGVVAVDYLVVAGGGGGASGGGGGGGVVTNREVRNASGTVLANRRSGLAVRSAETISVTVGRGGDYDFGGSGTGSRSGTSPNGSASLLGSIRANGGGGGGKAAGSGNAGGSSGGAAYDNNGGAVTAVTRSNVTGASTFGNLGGGSAQGSYSAGAGGGGSASVGGDARRIPFHGSNGQSNPSASSFTSCNDGGNRRGCFTFGGGGDGGAGVVTDIFSTSTFEYENPFGCGGGGGVNNNSLETVTATITGGNLRLQGNNATSFNFSSGTYSGGGSAGCSTSGRGSNYGGNSIANNRFNGTSATVSYGGGGGGTDPESNVAGNGGSGTVIISYFVNNSACPNNGVNATSTRPLACNFTISIRAGIDTVTVDSRGNPYSYSDTPTTTARLTIGVDSITITVSNNLFTISAPGTNNPLRGGTYPALYSLTTTGTDTSSAYINVNVTDPAQHSPTRVGINPWVTSVKVPSIVFGTVSAVLVCITPRASTASRYGNLPTVTMSSVAANALRTNLTNGGIKLEGTVESVTANASNFIINKNSSDTRLLPGSNDRVFDINVSNTATGGNGSCTGGSESTLSIYRLNYLQKNTKNLPLKNGKQP